LWRSNDEENSGSSGTDAADARNTAISAVIGRPPPWSSPLAASPRAAAAPRLGATGGALVGVPITIGLLAPHGRSLRMASTI
jgi:hypothetical protein